MAPAEQPKSAARTRPREQTAPTTQAALKNTTGSAYVSQRAADAWSSPPDGAAAIRNVASPAHSNSAWTHSRRPSFFPLQRAQRQREEQTAAKQRLNEEQAAERQSRGVETESTGFGAVTNEPLSRPSETREDRDVEARRGWKVDDDAILQRVPQAEECCRPEREDDCEWTSQSRFRSRAAFTNLALSGAVLPAGYVWPDKSTDGGPASRTAGSSSK